MALAARTFALAHAVRGRRTVSYAIARRRVRGALRSHRLLVRTQPPGPRFRWRSAAGRIYCGLVRRAHKRSRENVEGHGLEATIRVRPAWRWQLGQLGGPRRFHPPVWCLCMPPGGVLVVPDRVLQPAWREIMISGPGGYWLWKFWERWDVLLTFPDLPDDLVTGAPAPDAAAIRARCRAPRVRPPLGPLPWADPGEYDRWQRQMKKVGWSSELLAQL